MYKIDVTIGGTYTATLTDLFYEFRPFYCRPSFEAKDWHIFQTELRHNVDKANNSETTLPAAETGKIQD